MKLDVFFYEAFEEEQLAIQRYLPENIKAEFDLIFHCAASVSSKNKAELHKVNALGTENVCRVARQRRIKKMVYLSSVAVVSGNPEIPLVEDLPYKATNPYGESKIVAEKIALDYRKKGLNSFFAVVHNP